MKKAINILLLLVVGFIIAAMITISLMDFNNAPVIILILVIALATAVLIKNKVKKSE